MVRSLAGSIVLACLAAPLAHAGTADEQAHAAAAPASDAPFFDAQGYRTGRYRAPVDRPPDPARRIALDKALRLHARGAALFVDVLPVEGGYRDPVTGAWRLSQLHATIPGAAWHPETGRGAPDPVLWQALVGAVRQARQDHPRLPIVLFCRSDCWMGWNAARRLAQGGVRQVTWLAEGIDGWHDAGRTLVEAAPVAIAPRARAD